jgi:hypothetical protein
MSIPPFSIVSFSHEHPKAGFCCGTEILDRYFAECAAQDIKRNLARCFVAIDNEQQSIAGYYTLSAAQIPLTDLPEQLAKKMPRYGAIPASRIGRLTIDKRYQGRGRPSARSGPMERNPDPYPRRFYCKIVSCLMVTSTSHCRLSLETPARNEKLSEP